AAVALGAVVLRRVVRRRRHGRHDAARLVPPAGPFASRREQMAAWSDAVRAALAARFGPQWRARTTEEVAADPALAAALGPAPVHSLIGFLSRADLAKFDDREGLQSPLPLADVAPDWLVEFVASTSPSTAPAIVTVPAAGARSRISGK